MKKLLFLLLLFPTISWAQDMGMDYFKDYCLRVRQGVGNNDAKELMECIDGYDSTKYKDDHYFFYKDKKIQLFPLVLEIKDGEANGMGKHIMFTPDYIDAYIIANLEPVEIDPPSLTRGAYDCRYFHYVIKAHSECTFLAKDENADFGELFVVTEDGGLVNLTVCDVSGQNVIAQDKNGGPSAQAKWKFGAANEYAITVENVSDKDVSVIIVTD